MLEPLANIPIVIRNNHFQLLPERAVFWCEEKVLFLSDLHWGRERFLQSRGVALPEHSLEPDKKVIESLVARWNPSKIWILGDFIHHRSVVDDAYLVLIREWVSSFPGLEISLIPGNHDHGLELKLANCGISIAADGISRGDFTFAHEERNPDARFHWYGHLHPSIRIPGVSGNRKLPCFFMQENRAYLPAFSRLAGGADIRSRVRGDRIFAVAEEMVFELPT